MRFSGDFSVVRFSYGRVRELLRGVVVAAVVGGLGITLGVVPTATAAQEEVSDSGTASSPVVVVSERPDGFSAGAQARLQGSRVEDLSARTPSSQTFANPDGTWTTEDTGVPVRVEGKDGTWRDVDLNLVKASDGSYEPKTSAVATTVGAGGTPEAGKVTFEDGSSLAVKWPGGDLPVPTVVGGVATYALDATTDLVVSTTSTGVKVWYRINSAPTGSDGSASGVVGDTFDLDVVTDNLQVSTDGDSLTLTGADGRKIGETPSLVGWDASKDAAGDPADVVAVDAVLSPAETTTTKKSAVKSAQSGKTATSVVRETQRLSLELPQGYLTDPGTEFPVVVDPNISALVGAKDTWVRSGTTVSNGGDERLFVGRTGTNTNYALGLIQFPSSGQPYMGKTITAATLSLYQYYAESCAATVATGIFPVTSTWESSALWSNKPTYGGGVATLSTNRGGDGCAGTTSGFVSVPITSLVQGWANGSVPNYGIALRPPTAYTGTLSYGKRFCSLNYASADNNCFSHGFIPRISVTYSSPPSTPTTPTYTQTGSATGVTNLTRPVFTTKGKDPLGDKVKYEIQVFNSTTADATTLKSSCTTALVNSGVAASCAVGTALASGTYWVRAKTVNSPGLGSVWTGLTAFKVDVGAPVIAAVMASAYTNGGWLPVTPSANTFTVSSSSTDVVAFKYTRDGGTAQSVPATVSGSTRTAQVVWNAPGGHEFSVQAVDGAGNLSPAAVFTFGSGGAGIGAPTSAGVKTTGTTTLKATAPAPGSGTVTATAYWRVRGGAEAPDFSDTDGTATGWTEQNAGVVTTSATGVSASVVFDAATVAAAQSRARKTTVIDVQVCFTYVPSNLVRCTWTADEVSHATVTYVPHAFGENFPTAAAGPGQVALWTGEFSTSATDVSVPGYTGDLSISRTYNTFNDGSVKGVFGPGWTASFDGVDAGVAAVEVQDDTAFDGTISLVDDQGEAITFAQPGTTTTAQLLGDYEPVDEDGETSGATLKVLAPATSSGGKRLVFTEDDGTVTTWVFAGTQGWKVASVREPGANLTTTYEHDGAGRLTRIIAPTPSADTPITCEEGAEQAGCRVLTIIYGSSTTATATSSGDVEGQVKSASYTAYDPDKSGGAGMGTVTVATYSYDGAGRLVSVTDPRVGLATTYSYTDPVITGGVPLLVTITPAGLAPYTMSYSGVSGASTPFSSALEKVTRAGASVGAGPVVLSAYRYDVALTTPGLPALTVADVGVWGQQTAPTHAFAVFDQKSAGSVGATPSAEQFKDADLQFADDDGYTINTAVFGAGDWQITSTGFGAGGRVVRELDAGAIAQIRTDGAVAAANDVSVNPDSYATITRYNSDIIAESAITAGETTIAAGTVLTPAGTYVTDSWDPAEEVTDPDGTTRMIRSHTHTDYDQGAPTSGINEKTGSPFRLPTTVTVTEADPDSGSSDATVPVDTGEPVISVAKSGYDPIDGASVTSDTSGWVLGSATTSTTVVDGGADIVTRTRFDSQGRTVESRQPNSDGSGAGTTFTSYYSATALTGSNKVCGNTSDSPQASAAWAGLVCRTWKDSTALPVTQVIKYNRYLASASTTETVSGTSVVRTTTSTFDAAGRVVTSGTAVTGLSGSVPVPAATTTYSPTTGLATATSSAAGTIGTGYDWWGRSVTYTDTDGAVTTTAYNAAGQVATVTDPKGTTTYTYDSAGEHRGLLTAQSVTGVGSYTATYDAGGNMVTQTTPGGITQTAGFDRTGRRTSLTYTTDAGELAGWDTGFDREGKVSVQHGPSATGGDRTQTFTYDQADRLTGVADTIDGVCTARGYGFDVNGNRLSKTTKAYAAVCLGTPTSTVSKAWTYDGADRVQTGANGSGSYVYDGLGRQTSIPGADTPKGSSAGALTVQYFDDDLAKSLTQNGVTTTFGLDAVGRRSVQTTTGTTPTTVTRHYTDTSDNPGWATSTAGSTTKTTRYTGSIGGDLSATVTEGVVTVDVADLQGTVATSVTVDASGVGTVGALGVYDEYGNTITAGPATGAVSYGWLGGKERATEDTTGLVLMGVRLYNSVTGLFTSVDPVEGGNTTAYVYPQDPINKYDLDGKAWWRTALKVAAVVGGVAGAVACAGSIVCGVVVGAAAGAASYAAAHAGTRSFRWSGLARSAVVGGVLGGIGARGVGPSGRLFGNSTMGAKRPGLWNNARKGSGKSAIGWSMKSRGKGVPAQSVFRYKTRSGTHHDIYRSSSR